jgi:UDP-3-O-[3-hydroxymyristoyl] glucosamine N-acyltransferase
LTLGVTDGLVTAGIEGSLQVGDRVIIGAEAEVAKSASLVIF